MRCRSVFFTLLLSVLPVCSGFGADQDSEKLKQSFEDDLQYYHRVLEGSGREAKIEYLEELIRRYRAQGLEEMYLIHAKDAVAQLKQGPEEPSQIASVPEEPMLPKTAEKWYVGPRIGVSPFTGLLGIEAQREHLAFFAGLAPRFGMRYYFRFPKHSWFVGAIYSHYSYEEKQGAVLQNKTFTETGPGGGFRWRWGTGWDLELAMALLQVKEEDAATPFTRSKVKKSTVIFPGVSFGYSF